MSKTQRMLVAGLLLVLCIVFMPNQISRAFVEECHVEMVTVKKGDTLWRIAAKYSSEDEDIRVKIAAIRRLNQLNDDLKIYPGQVLQVPVDF